MNPTHLRQFLPLIALVFLSGIWGVTWVVVKQALLYAPPFAFAAERSVGGALALLLVMKLLRRPVVLVAPVQTMLIAFFQISAFMVFQTWALVEGGPGKTAVLIFTMPIITLLMAWPMLGERIRGTQWIAAICTLTGLMLIIEPWDMHANLLSRFLGVMAALCWAIGTILTKRLRARDSVDLLSHTTWQLIFGAVPLVLLSAVIPERPTQWVPTYIGMLAFIAIASMALCWLLWSYILDRLPAWEASLSVLGTPAVAIVSSRLLLGEEFKLTETAGILLIGSGLALLSLFGWWSSRKN